MATNDSTRRSRAPAELLVGIEAYATPTPPCASRLRSKVEDFEVEEALREGLPSGEPEKRLFPLYRVRKNSIDTLHMARELSEALGSRVSYAGIKDKRAAAVQYVSPTSGRASAPDRVERPRFSAELVGFLPRPFSRSMVVGNRFRITMRDCCAKVEDSLIAALRAGRLRLLPNYYGVQRFGSRDPITHKIGKALIQSRFQDAVALLLTVPRAHDEQEARRARELMEHGDYEAGLRKMPRAMDVERMVAKRLARGESDPVKALRAVPIQLRRLYTQAYQSFIFNKTLSVALLKGVDISSVERGDNWGETGDAGLTLRKVHGVRESPAEGGVPLVQIFGYAFRDYGSRFDSCLKEVVEEEGIAARDFYVKDMQEVSQEGGFRRPFLTIREEAYQVSGDTAVVSFLLARGEYATTVLREVIKTEDPFSSGFD
ncbi:MAG TPA: tRNA pseudouridine(13) synthase TruD [Nitrososphaerales archaeon]|nr:tRNA pseudouridine(13) synthase TruD [Nitrososphaerales archaeon]